MPERFTETLRTTSELGWSHAVQHRFVNELFAGAVPDAVMARYLIQDHRFLDSFLVLLGAALASADTFAARLRFGRFIGMVSAEENTYFLRAFEALGVTKARRAADPDTQPTIGFKAIMREAADTRTYAAALSVLVVAEWLYLDWASRAPHPLPNNFVHAEWITLHDNPNFRGFVDFLRTELDRVGPEHEDLCRDLFSRAVALEPPFSKPPIRPEFLLRTSAPRRREQTAPGKLTVPTDQAVKAAIAAFAGPMVRNRLFPAEGLRTIGPPQHVRRGGWRAALVRGRLAANGDLRRRSDRLAAAHSAQATRTVSQSGPRDTAARTKVRRLVWGFSCQVVIFGFLAILCSERECRSSSRRLRSGSWSARKGSRDRNA